MARKQGLYQQFREYLRIADKEDILQTLSLVEKEAVEHFRFFGWTVKRLLLPLSAAYILFGLLGGVNVLGSLTLSMIVFLYSSMLPDVDLIFKTASRRTRGSPRPSKFEKYFVLFFAPLYIYYIIAESRRVYSTVKRPFHTFHALLSWGAFLCILGIVLYHDSLLKMFSLPLFGMLGFWTHLKVDGRRV